MPAHIDNQNAWPVVTIISLASTAQMRLEKDEQSLILDLTPRSLLQMSGEIRNKWTHEVLPLKADRVSLVFRCI
jgi:alkylated DNA repair dioxygenase AlkB